MTATDLAATVALRMDDPGTSASVHLDPWRYEKLDPELWREVGDILEREGATMSVGYTPGWVDDGDAGRGELFVGGEAVERAGGRVHPSAHVRYAGLTTTSGDYTAEFAALAELRDRGLVSIDLHGYTHVRPELERWARSPTAHTKQGWWREIAPEVGGLMAATAPDERPVARGMRLLRELTGETPTVLLCPQNACAEIAFADAFANGFATVVDRTLSVRGRDGFERPMPVENVAFHHPEQLASPLPVVAAFHDRDLALNGPQWLAAGLARWRAAGARRFVDVATLAAEVSTT